MEKVIDYLGEQIKHAEACAQKEATKTRKAGKHERCAKLMQKFAKEQPAVRTGSFHAAGGSLFYLVSGRKP